MLPRTFVCFTLVLSIILVWSTTASEETAWARCVSADPVSAIRGDCAAEDSEQGLAPTSPHEAFIRSFFDEEAKKVEEGGGGEREDLGEGQEDPFRIRDTGGVQDEECKGFKRGDIEKVMSANFDDVAKAVKLLHQSRSTTKHGHEECVRVSMQTLENAKAPRQEIEAFNRVYNEIMSKYPDANSKQDVSKQDRRDVFDQSLVLLDAALGQADGARKRLGQGKGKGKIAKSETETAAKTTKSEFEASVKSVLNTVTSKPSAKAMPKHPSKATSKQLFGDKQLLLCYVQKRKWVTGGAQFKWGKRQLAVDFQHTKGRGEKDETGIDMVFQKAVACLDSKCINRKSSQVRRMSPLCEEGGCSRQIYGKIKPSAQCCCAMKDRHGRGRGSVVCPITKEQIDPLHSKINPEFLCVLLKAINTPRMDEAVAVF